MDNISRPYQDELLKALTDPVEAAAYLNAALDEGTSELFILALHNVAKAQTMKPLADQSQKNIPVSSQVLSDPEHLRLLDLPDILEILGLRFAVAAHQS